MTDRKKPGVAFWATVMVVVLLEAYPLSLGPNFWLAERGAIPVWADEPIRVFYVPLSWVYSAFRDGANGVRLVRRTMGGIACWPHSNVPLNPTYFPIPRSGPWTFVLSNQESLYFICR